MRRKKRGLPKQLPSNGEKVDILIGKCMKIVIKKRKCADKEILLTITVAICKFVDCVSYNTNPP